MRIKVFNNIGRPIRRKKKRTKTEKCQKVLSLEKITDKIQKGLHSRFKSDCLKYKTKNAVLTGMYYKKIKNRLYLTESKLFGFKTLVTLFD